MAKNTTRTRRQPTAAEVARVRRDGTLRWRMASGTADGVEYIIIGGPSGKLTCDCEGCYRMHHCYHTRAVQMFEEQARAASAAAAVATAEALVAAAQDAAVAERRAANAALIRGLRPTAGR